MLKELVNKLLFFLNELTILLVIIIGGTNLCLKATLIIGLIFLKINISIDATIPILDLASFIIGFIVFLYRYYLLAYKKTKEPNLLAKICLFGLVNMPSTKKPN